MAASDLQRDLLFCIGGALIAIAGPGLSAYFLHGHALLAVLVVCLVIGLVMVGMGAIDIARRKRRGGRHTSATAGPDPSPLDATVRFNRLRPADSLRPFSIPLRSGMAENIDELLTEVPALRERVSMPFLADDRSLDLDLSDWERRVVAVLGDRADLVDWFNSEPPKTGPADFVRPLPARLEHHVRMLSAIRDRL